MRIANRHRFPVMAGLVPAITTGSVPRRMAGTGSAMTETAESLP